MFCADGTDTRDGSCADIRRGSGPNAAEAGRVSQEAAPIEQGQLLRAVEPDEWAMSVRAKPNSGNANTTTARYHLLQNNYSFDALQAYCFGINLKL